MWIFGWKGPSGFSACFTAEQVTQGIDETGLTAIVTGASSGIGVETARVLALRGVHVVMAVTIVDAGTNVKEAILKEIPSANIDVMQLDLSSMASVRKFASEYISTGLPLNLLMTFSSDGPLLETMKNTARESNHEGRIVNVSSEGHRFSYREGIRFDEINEKSRYNFIHAYGQSKLATTLHANELARRLKEDGVDITANSLHPGVIGTNLSRHHNIFHGVVSLFGKYLLKNVQQGAATTCYVALHPQVKGVTSEYFMDSNLAKPSGQAKDAELAKKLWEFTWKLTNQVYAYVTSKAHCEGSFYPCDGVYVKFNYYTNYVFIFHIYHLYGSSQVLVGCGFLIIMASLQKKKNNNNNNNMASIFCFSTFSTLGIEVLIGLKNCLLWKNTRFD